MSNEKIDLAKKVFSYVESNLAKINRKMSSMEEKMIKNERKKQQSKGHRKYGGSYRDDESDEE